ncbi:MAG: SUMF1/EgtB/PvdO family nonheme iron enzyme [Bacteroidetes bacterium]|nr:SUMF1/EgtB/PvdO family nonheme iron enzyme [Bacteroidota bacterium]
MRSCNRRIPSHLSTTITVVLLSLLPLLAGMDTHAQSLTLFKPDISEYPLLRAGLYAYDAEGRPRLDLAPGDFVLMENGVPRRIIDVSCPPVRDPKPLSAVLTVDVSGSMLGAGLVLAQTAAEAWIEAFPGGTSECAVTSFNTSNALHQDFTNDKALLRTAVASLQAGGGTSFDAALINPFAGALGVVARGRHARTVVLLTDGYAGGSEAAIIAMAQQVGARIYCITLDNVMPDILRRVAEQSGGLWFENVTTAEEARSIYRSILDLAQELPPCVITWESEGCDHYRDVLCSLPGSSVAARSWYQVPNSSLPWLSVTPSRVLAFGAVAPGSSADMTVTLRAEARPVTITAITPEFPLFSVVDFGGSAPPFTLQPGEQRTLTVRYAAEDSSYLICRFFIDSDACEGGFFATAGDPGKGRDRRVIRLLHPNGGEVFVAGSDTVITWEGVAPTDPVRLEYSTNNGATWRLIADNVRGLSYNWRVPNTPSDQCLARVTAPLPTAVPDGMVIVPAGSFIMGDVTGVGTMEERPAHRVTITQPFLMGRTEVTRRQWREIGLPGIDGGVGPDDGPALGIDLWSALLYCNVRSLREGLNPCYLFEFYGYDVTCNWYANGYRLPTEAEWEYACREGGSEDFHSGPMLEPYCEPVDRNLDLVGWYCGNALGSPQRCAQKKENAFGLFDMHGNAAEWCWGNIDTPYVGTDQVDPGKKNPLQRTQTPVARGGAFNSPATLCRASARIRSSWNQSPQTHGFRVVRTY